KNPFNKDRPRERYLLQALVETGDAVRSTPEREGFPIAGYFCITLEHRKDRYRSFSVQMACTRHRWIAPIQEYIRPGVWCPSFSDIPGRIAPLARYLKAKPEDAQLGTIGCYLAHVRVLEEIAARHTDQWYVVFEDDVRIRSAYWLSLLGGLRLPPGFEDTRLVLVDPRGERRAEDEIEPRWFRPSTTSPHYYGSHCYIVLGSQAARDVLSALARHPYLEDVDSLILKSGLSLAWYPEVVGILPQGSDRKYRMAAFPWPPAT